MIKGFRAYLVTLCLAALALQGCSGIAIPSARSATGRAPEVPEFPNPDETVRGADDPPIVTLPVGNRLKGRPLTRTEPLPSSIIIPGTTLDAVPVTAALQAVLEGSDVSLSWATGDFDDRLVTVSNLSGPLSEVVEKICAAAKVFCPYRRGLLELKQQETFVIELPSVPTSSGGSGAATNTMAETIEELAGGEVKIDQQGGNLIYTTDAEGHERVGEYLTQLRHGRPLIVMQLYIWEVLLDSDHGAGINWTSLDLGAHSLLGSKLALSSLSGFSNLATPGISLGAKLTGKLDADAVFKFLSTQGQVQTISNPQLTFVSGSSAEFRVGGQQRYISQVGQLTTTSVSGSTSSSGVGTNTVSTESIDTGLTVTLGGVFESGIINSVLELEIGDIVSLNPTTVSGGLIVNLPETSERKVETSLRVRPGDNLLLAGLNQSRDTNDREGLPLPFGANVNTYARDQLRNSELVVLVKPSVVLFADAQEDQEEGGAQDRPARRPAKKKTIKAEPLPPPVVIDKDGMREMALPEDPASAALAAAAPPAPAPELMVPASTQALALAPLSGIPVEPSADGAPVDKRLLQRGFSHAFDQMIGAGGDEAQTSRKGAE